MESENEYDWRAERGRHAMLLTLGTAIAIAIWLLLTVSEREVRDVGGFPGVSVTPYERSKQLYIGVPQEGVTLGSPRAPLRMVVFVDLQCVLCAPFSHGVLPAIVNNYVRTERVQLVLWPLAQIGPDSAKAARAAAGAAQQDRLWQFADFFLWKQGLENSGYVTPSFLGKVSREAGAAPDGILAHALSHQLPPLLAHAARVAKRYRVTGTPTFFMGGRGGPLARMTIPYMNVNEFAVRLSGTIPP
jgi:protein-disulfide isomerase